MRFRVTGPVPEVASKVGERFLTGHIMSKTPITKNQTPINWHLRLELGTWGFSGVWSFVFSANALLNTLDACQSPCLLSPTRRMAEPTLYFGTG
jgi:hypothetical protein